MIESLEIKNKIKKRKWNEKNTHTHIYKIDYSMIQKAKQLGKAEIKVQKEKHS